IGASRRLPGIRRGRSAPARGARAGAERARERRAAQARRGPGRRPAPRGAARRSVRRSGPVVHPQRRLGRPRGVRGAAGALMSRLPIAARGYVLTVIAVGGLLFAARIRSATFAHPVLFVALLALASLTAALKVYLPLTTGGSTLSVSYAV